MKARDLRLLFVVAGAVVFFDTVFYAAVVPLLPSLTRQLHLSKASAGVLTAGYAAGTLVGSLPGGMLAERYGPRVTLYAGLTMMGGASLAFGLLNNVALLDAARFVQGLGGACTWAGSMVWVILVAPPEQRGSAIGGALAAGIAGALVGPVVGTLAHALGRGPVFSAVLLVAAGLAIALTILPAPPAQHPARAGPSFARQLRQPAIVLGMWLVALPAMASGAINVLGPLRLGQLGAGAAAIGATFLVAAGAEASISPMVGRVSDRRGRIFPLRIGLAAAAVALLLFTLPKSGLLLAVVIMLETVALGAFWAPAMAMLSDAADAHGMSQAYALALINFAWAAGQIVGAGGGGSLAKVAGDGVPFAVGSALCVATLSVILVRGDIKARRSAQRVGCVATPGAWQRGCAPVQPAAPSASVQPGAPSASAPPGGRRRVRRGKFQHSTPSSALGAGFRPMTGQNPTVRDRVTPNAGICPSHAHPVPTAPPPLPTTPRPPPDPKFPPLRVVVRGRDGNLGSGTRTPSLADRYVRNGGNFAVGRPPLGNPPGCLSAAGRRGRRALDF